MASKQLVFRELIATLALIGTVAFAWVSETQTFEKEPMTAGLNFVRKPTAFACEDVLTSAIS
eukprot:547203-Pleurochrysis_carterae.AAC.3